MNPKDRVSAPRMAEILEKDPHAVLIDVRPENEFNIAHHPKAINVPINSFMRSFDGFQTLWHICKESEPDNRQKPLTKFYFICRRGNDSQRVLLHCKTSAAIRGNKQLEVADVIGGYLSWKSEVDPNFPEY